MAISFFCGKPGNGKTLAAVRFAIKELLTTDRMIVTNVSFVMDEITLYIATRYPDVFEQRFSSRGIRVSDRFLLLDEIEFKTFFYHRHVRNVVKKETDVERLKAGIELDFSAAKDCGCFYILDEIHIPYNSRNFQKTGAEVLFYTSQHRKMGDDVIAISQCIENVDKQFRSVGQDFIYFRHLAKSKAMMFKLPNIFIWQSYLKPVGGTSAQKPLEVGYFKLDVKGFCKLYDTRKGVGIMGVGSADKGKKRSGIPWQLFIIGLGVFALIPILFMHYGVRWALLKPQRLKEEQQEHYQETHTNNTVYVQPEDSKNLVQRMQEVISNNPSLKESFSIKPESFDAGSTDDVVCTGYVDLPADALVFLSNHKTYHSAWHQVEVIRPDKVEVEGKWYDVQVGVASCSITQSYVGVTSYPETKSDYSAIPPVIVLPRHDNYSLSHIRQGGFQNVEENQNQYPP